MFDSRAVRTTGQRFRGAVAPTTMSYFAALCVAAATQVAHAQAPRAGQQEGGGVLEVHLGTALVLESHFPKEDLAAVSEGWAGDTLAVFAKDGAAPLVLWATAWDRDADAVDFHGQAVRLAGRLAQAEAGTSGAQRRGSVVLLSLNLPGGLLDKALDAAWGGKRDGRPLDDGR